MIVLGVDFETTGLNCNEDHITEIGAMLWDTGSNKPMNPILSTFVKVPVALTEEITKITGITDADLRDHGYEPKVALGALAQMMGKAEAIVAHNGNMFDRPMLEGNAKRHSVEMPSKLWIDTTTDIEYPPTITTRKLTHLAAEHGFVNPFAHRAIFDVSTMLQVAGKYDWELMVKYAKSPTLVIAADVPYQQRELAKKQNFRWDGASKMWVKSVKDFQLAEVRKVCQEAGFRVTVIKGAV